MNLSLFIFFKQSNFFCSSFLLLLFFQWIKSFLHSFLELLISALSIKMSNPETRDLSYSANLVSRFPTIDSDNHSQTIFAMQHILSAPVLSRCSC